MKAALIATTVVVAIAAACVFIGGWIALVEYWWPGPVTSPWPIVVFFAPIAIGMWIFIFVVIRKEG